MIHKHSSELLFSLQSNNSSYIIGIYREKCLLRYYFGKVLDLPSRNRDFFQNSPRATEVMDLSCNESSSYLPVEFSTFSSGDFRPASLTIRDSNGYPITDFRYDSYEIVSGVFHPSSMPPLGGNDNYVETIKFHFRHQNKNLLVSLFYSVFQKHDVFLRWMRIKNEGREPYVIERAMSATAAFPANEWELISLDGSHARERAIHRSSLRPGIIAIGSTCGVSSHTHNPWTALVHQNTTHSAGDGFATGLIYSGNFLMETHMADDGQIRMNTGMHPETTGHKLLPGLAFDTPQAISFFSDRGLNGLTRISHTFINEWLTPKYWRKRERPVLLNSWEGVYFNYDEEKLMEIAQKSCELGVELFVLDDGWFGHRNDDKSSLGDWFCNYQKLPQGVQGFAEKIHALGMQFGIWVEPEMISVKSDLYKQHPDWCLHVPSDTRLEGRYQLVLDFSRTDVKENIINQLRTLLNSAKIDYVKWDMNRYHSNVGSALTQIDGNIISQREIPRRFTEGLYEVLGTITTEYPQILFEGCAGGGGRYDLGMMTHFPQYWTSDNTDAISRLKIQYGTSLFYPQITMGSHVADIPGHQVGRNTPLLLRSMVAMGGNYGLELDPTRISKDDFALLKQEIAWYKRHRSLLQNGIYRNLISPFDSDTASWIITSEDKRKAVAFYFVPFGEGNQGSRFWKLAGLEPDWDYRIAWHKTGLDLGTVLEGAFPYTISGNELMTRGLYLDPIERDYYGLRILLRVENL